MVYRSFLPLNGQTWEVIASDTGIQEIRLTDMVMHAQESEVTRQAAQQLRAYWDGTLQQFDLPLDLQGTSFQKQVWEVLRDIPYGKTMCYSDVAQKLGRPSAVRAVANAIGKNPCLIVVPCHRVLGKNGSLTGFSAGLDLKKQLLQIEQIPHI